MILELLVGVVVVPPDGTFLEGAVHPLDLAVGPGMVGLGQAMLDAQLVACSVERMAAPHGRRAGSVLRQIGELDAVVRQHGVDLAGDGRKELFQERPGGHACGSLDQSSEGVLRRPVHGHEEVQLGLLCADSAMSMWK